MYTTRNSALIVTESEISKDYDLSSLKEINNEKDLKKISTIFDKNGIPEIDESSAITQFQLYRLLSMFSAKPVKFDYQGSQHLFKNYVTPSYNIKDLSNNSFVDLLCMDDVLSAAASSLTLSCSVCLKSRRSKEFKYSVFIPHREKDSPFVSWLRRSCFDRQSPKTKFEMKSSFPEIHQTIENCGQNCPDDKIIESFEKMSKRVKSTISTIKQRPIGNQRSIIPVVISLHDEFIKILKVFRQRLIQMENISSNDLVTIKDVTEYNARIGNNQCVVKVPEPDIEVVDKITFTKFIEEMTETCHENLTSVLTMSPFDLYKNIQ